MAAAAKSEDIHGTVIVKQRLTKKRVTAAPALYQRGPAVELRSDANGDPLGDERSRVVVYLEGPLPSSVTPRTPAAATMEQKDRRFIPELLVIPVGSTVSFPNLDPIFHNIFSLSKPKSFDLGNYTRDHTRVVTFSKPGIEFINCHLHPNMSATIFITPGEWYTIADRDGRFCLRDIPPGSYTIVAWHKAVGWFRQSARVEPKRGASIEFFLPLGERDGEDRARVEARR